MSEGKKAKSIKSATTPITRLKPEGIKRRRQKREGK